MDGWVCFPCIDFIFIVILDCGKPCLASKIGLDCAIQVRASQELETHRTKEVQNATSQTECQTGCFPCYGNRCVELQSNHANARLTEHIFSLQFQPSWFQIKSLLFPIKGCSAFNYHQMSNKFSLVPKGINKCAGGINCPPPRTVCLHWSLHLAALGNRYTTALPLCLHGLT